MLVFQKFAATFSVATGWTKFWFRNVFKKFNLKFRAPLFRKLGLPFSIFKNQVGALKLYVLKYIVLGFQKFATTFSVATALTKFWFRNVFKKFDLKFRAPLFRKLGFGFSKIKLVL